MKTQNQKAFTLVELIVVITILIILGTIAFISLEGYSKNSRDGVRVADVNSARKSLELFITEKGFYPIPDNPTNVVYSGATAWTQGTIGDGVIRNLDKIDKKIVDPLTENEYTYSITSSKTEYQIGAVTEGGTIGYKLPINQTHAATEKKATAMVRGTYNERFLRVQSGTLNWILAIPSIIATDLTQTDVQTILTNNKLVYNNYQNIPHSYNNAGYIMTGGFNYTNTNPLIYSGSLKNLTESNTGKLDFITGLKAAYNGTILHGEANYKDIVNIEPSNQTGAVYLVNRFINTNLGGIKVSNIILPTSGTLESLPTYTCIGSLVTDNAYITNTGGLTANTNYQNSDINGLCYYTCTGGFIGLDCNEIPIVTVLGSVVQNAEYQTANSTNWKVYTILSASTNRDTNTITFNGQMRATGTGTPPTGSIWLYLQKWNGTGWSTVKTTSATITTYKTYSLTSSNTFSSGTYRVYSDPLGLSFDVAESGQISNASIKNTSTNLEVGTVTVNNN